MLNTQLSFHLALATKCRRLCSICWRKLRMVSIQLRQRLFFNIFNRVPKTFRCQEVSSQKFVLMFLKIHCYRLITYYCLSSSPYLCLHHSGTSSSWFHLSKNTFFPEPSSCSKPCCKLSIHEDISWLWQWYSSRLFLTWLDALKLFFLTIKIIQPSHTLIVFWDLSGCLLLQSQPLLSFFLTL